MGHHAPGGSLSATHRGRSAVISSLRRFDYALTDGVGHHLSPVLDVELVQNIAQVIFEGVFADHPLFGKLAIAGDTLHQ